MQDGLIVDIIAVMGTLAVSGLNWRMFMGVLDGTTAIVTGANRGIGLGIARAFAREGARLVLAARDAVLLDSVAEGLRDSGSEVEAIPTDVTVEGDADELIDRTVDRFGHLDLLVNNAGTGNRAPMTDMDLDTWQTTIATNLTGAFLCSRAALRVMRQAQRGRIINVASISSQRVRPESAAYSASKFGLWGLTQVIALEGREYGVSCSCLNPGNTLVDNDVLTARQDASGQYFGRAGLDGIEEPLMTVDELATVAVTMAAMPDHVNMLEATVLPVGQPYVGRG